MKNWKSTKTLVFLAVPMLFLLTACGKGHPDIVHDNSPERLPLRLRLPADGSPETAGLIQYGPDNINKKVEVTFLGQGPFAGGMEYRIYEDNNRLRRVLRLYGKDQLGYLAEMDNHGNYASEQSWDRNGTRQTDGKQLPDGTFEQNTYYADGVNLFKHTIFGRLMIKKPRPSWKSFTEEYHRENLTVAAIKQLMDDGAWYDQFFDEQHNLSEVLYIKSSTTEIDYAPGKIPIRRIDFGSVPEAWDFDQKGQLVSHRKWWTSDGSWQFEVFRAGKPIYAQDWEVDHAKSDTSSHKIVLYLQWIKEFNPDESVRREIHFRSSGVVEQIEVQQAPPREAKFKALPDVLSLNAMKPAVNWTPPPPDAKKPATTAASTTTATSNVGTTTATPLAPEFWSASGAKEKYYYSEKGFLAKVEYYQAGKSEAVKTVTHKDSERIRPRISPQLLQPLVIGPAPDKPKDQTPSEPSRSMSFPFDID